MSERRYRKDNDNPTQARSRQARSHHKRQRIIKAARAAFARHGFSKTSIQDIARKAGTGKATLYYHFESKEDIFRAVVQHESDLFLEKVREAVRKAPSPTERFRAFVVVRYSYLRELKTLFAITHEAVEELLPLAQKQRDRYFESELELLKEILADGVADGTFELDDIDASALALIAGVWGFDTVVLTYGQATSILEGLEGMITLILRGLLRRD